MTKGRVDKALPKPEKGLEFEAGINKKYEVKAIIDSAMYSQQANNQIPGLYYLVLWKGYPEKENTWKPSSAVIYLRKLINTFHKEHSEKPTATFPSLDSTPPMVRLIIPKESKQKRGCPSKGANKRGRNWSIRNVRAVPFVAPDIDVILKHLIESPRPYPQSINQHPIFLHHFPSLVLEVFHSLQSNNVQSNK